MRNCLRTILTAAILTTTIGCASATKTVSDKQVAILASTQRGHDALARATAFSDNIAVGALVAIEEADTEFTVIEQAATITLAQVPKLDDKASWFDKLLSSIKIIAVVILILAAIGASIYFGIGKLIRRLFGAVGLFIPVGDRHRARMAAKVEYKEITFDEYVAAERGRNRHFNTAYQYEHRKMKI